MEANQIKGTPQVGMSANFHAWSDARSVAELFSHVQSDGKTMTHELCVTCGRQQVSIFLSYDQVLDLALEVIKFVSRELPAHMGELAKHVVS